MVNFLLGVCITCLAFVGIGIYYGWKLSKDDTSEYIVIKFNHED